MAYRSEQEGRRARIDELEHELALARRETEALQKKLTRALDTAATFRKLAEKREYHDTEARWQSARRAFAAGLGPAVLAWMISAVLAMMEIGQAAWLFANLSIFLAVLAPVPGWWRAGHPLIGMIAVGAKLGLWMQLGLGWWSLSYASAYSAGAVKALTVFWMFPPSVLLIGLLEAAAARRSVYLADHVD